MMSYAQWGNALYSGEKSYAIVPKRRIFVRAAYAVIAVCIVLIAILGLNRSFEFTGGSQIYTDRSDQHLTAAGIRCNPEGQLGL